MAVGKDKNKWGLVFLDVTLVNTEGLYYQDVNDDIFEDFDEFELSEDEKDYRKKRGLSIYNYLREFASVKKITNNIYFVYGGGSGILDENGFIVEKDEPRDNFICILENINFEEMERRKKNFKLFEKFMDKFPKKLDIKDRYKFHRILEDMNYR